MTPTPTEPQIESITLVGVDEEIIPYERGGSYYTSMDNVPNKVVVDGIGLFDLNPCLFKGSDFQTRNPYTDTQMGYFISGPGIYTLHAGGLDGELLFTFYFGDE